MSETSDENAMSEASDENTMSEASDENAMFEASDENAMSEASDETAMSAPIQENPEPEPSYNFRLKMKPLKSLRDAIEALIDPEFKNDEYGIVEVNSDSLIISTESHDNANAIATAALFVKSSGMIGFENYMPPPSMVRMYAPLGLISRYLEGVESGNDTFVIFHLKGTNQLHFVYATVPQCGSWVQIVENPGASMFPKVAVFTEITVPGNDIREMCDYMLQAYDPNTDKVHIDWKEGLVTFEIGSGKKWEYPLEEAKESEKGKIFHGWFIWRYLRVVREASFLAEQVTVQFLTAPEQHVSFQVHVGELVELFLFEKADLVLPDLSVDESAPDEDVSDDSVPLDTPSTSSLH